VQQNFVFIFRRKVKFQPNLTSATAFLFSTAKLTSVTAFFFWFCQQTYLSERILSKTYLAAEGSIEQAQITGLSRSFFCDKIKN
jgi:hypothetical protein